MASMGQNIGNLVSFSQQYSEMIETAIEPRFSPTAQSKMILGIFILEKTDISSKYLINL